MLRNNPLQLALVLAAFLLPFGGAMPSICMLLIGLSMFRMLITRQLALRIHSPVRVVLLLLLFASYLAGTCYSSRADLAWHSLQIALPLLLWPLLLSIASPVIRVTPILRSFGAGCAVALGACLLHAGFEYLFITHYIDSLFYANLSLFVHPGYFAMYLLFAICLALVHPLRSRLLQFGLMIWLVSGIFLLSSRTTLLSLALLALIGLPLYFLLQKRWKISLLIITSFLILSGVTWKLLDEVQRYRISRLLEVFHESKPDLSSVESLDARIFAWKSAASLIAGRPAFGYGTGMADLRLQGEYQRRGLSGLLSEKLNAHNEYLQIWLTLGIPGLLALLLHFGAGLPVYMKRRYWPGLAFIFLIFIHFLTESMLERQAGVAFFAFFNALLLFTQEKNPYPAIP